MTRLFHVSEESDIEYFEPRPSPQRYEQLSGDVVFAITGEMLHLYLTPRDCPRVVYTSGPFSREADIERYLGTSGIIMAVESAWLSAMRETALYIYELPGETFELLDENAGYYISYQAVRPMNVYMITNPLSALIERAVDVVFMADLRALAEQISRSGLRFSCIRMGNARH